jgi:hypothetical protein
MGTPQRKKNSDKKTRREKIPPRPVGQAPLLNLPDDATAAGTNNRCGMAPQKNYSVAPFVTSRFCLVSPRLSLYRLDNCLNPVADSIAKQTITAFLPRAILFNTCKVLFNIIESTVEKFRRGLHDAIDGRVAIYQD